MAAVRKSPRLQYNYAALLLAFATLGPLGCQSDGSASKSRGDAHHADAMKMRAPASDGEFAAMMAVHHKGAIEMGRYASQNGTRQNVRSLARKIADAQSAENVKLHAIASETGHAEHTSDPIMEQHTTKDMAALRAARGGDVDSVFLARMIDHHTMGVDMATKAMPNLKRDDLRRMAQAMIDDQSREIAQMRGMVN